MKSRQQTHVKAHERGQWLCTAGWGMFGLSMILPAVHALGWIYGWECFRLVFDGAWDFLAGRDGIGAYGSGFAVINAAMLASPLMVRLVCKSHRTLRAAACAIGFATAYAASYVAYGDFALGDFGPGYYVWLLSFGLVAAGIAHLAVRQAATTKRNCHRGLRSAEEIVAEHELEGWLDGSIISRQSSVC